MRAENFLDPLGGTPRDSGDLDARRRFERMEEECTALLIANIDAIQRQNVDMNKHWQQRRGRARSEDGAEPAVWGKRDAQARTRISACQTHLTQSRAEHGTLGASKPARQTHPEQATYRGVRGLPARCPGLGRTRLAATRIPGE